MQVHGVIFELYQCFNNTFNGIESRKTFDRAAQQRALMQPFSKVIVVTIMYNVIILYFLFVMLATLSFIIPHFAF